MQSYLIGRGGGELSVGKAEHVLYNKGLRNRETFNRVNRRMGQRQRTVESEQFTISFEYHLNFSRNLSLTVALASKSN